MSGVLKLLHQVAKPAVQDAAGRALPFATAVLLHLPDSATAAGWENKVRTRRRSIGALARSAGGGGWDTAVGSQMR